MIPIRDTVHRRGSAPAVTAVIALNVIVFLYALGLSPLAERYFIYEYGLLPILYTPPAGLSVSQLSVFDYYTPFVSYTFLHGGWLHIIFNLWTLWIFGRAMEQRLGSVRFLLFYAGAGVAAGLVHVAFNPGSQIPVVGASGAVAGVIAAYAVSYPRAEITLLIPIIIFPLFINIPALVFAGLWFGVQVLQGWGSLSADGGGGIAWWAHAGGFIAGIALLPLLATADRKPRPWDHIKRR